MRFLGTLVLGAAALVAAAALPAPARAAGASYTVVRETAKTSDGVTLAIRRLAEPGAVPVLLVHGLGSNGEEWDLPGKSFARDLAGAGYDVWIANCRRTGKAPYRSGGAAGYTFDDLACRDLPALVDAVLRATGERPFLVGHSMGGMMIEAWLQGCDLEPALVRKDLAFSLARGVRVVDVTALRVAGSAGRAAARAASIRGAVAIASPPAFDWPENQATVLDFWRHDYWNYNILLRDLSWSPGAIAAAYAFPEVPAGALVDFLERDLLSLPYVGAAARPYLEAVEAQVGTSFLSAEVAYGPNLDAQDVADGLRLAIDDTSNGVFRQLMDGIRTRSLREAAVLDPLRAPYVYADHHDRISAPFLYVTGSYDKLCNEETAYARGFRKIGSADKTYLGPLPFGHVDLVIGRDAPAAVWAPVERWLAARK
ncbi:MAG TPA: alpha/beta fold hydrolase [Planctomycetota bacterium]|nr:alpha/beta fold hydrolase [Planctomycetota bacterium]